MEGHRRRSAAPLRIALISPKGPLYRHRGGIFRRSLRYQPLTLTTLAALVPADVKAELIVIDEGIADVPESLDVDLAGLTVITGTAPRAYELSAQLRGRGVTTVLGRPRKIIFVDLNLIADRSYAIELFKALVPLNVQWYGLSTTLIGRDDEMLALAERSGCRGLLLGFESLSPANLRTSRKGFNHPDDYAALVEKLHGH